MPSRFTRESELIDALATRINPFWHDEVTTGYFAGKDGIDVHYAWCKPADAHATIVISSGRIESLLKYKELIYDLYQQGFAVFIADHRGQGLSGRMTHDPQHGYVGDFADYVDDLITFTNTIVAPNQAGERYLLCHSMGGAIGALTLLKDPELFSKAALCSPMFGVRPALPGWLSSLLIRAGLAFNRMRKLESGYFFGQTPYIAFPYALNKLTHSETRYRLFRDLYDRERQIQLGGVTTEWLAAAIRAMDTIEQRAGEITTPVLLVSATEDKIIDNRRQLRVAEKMPAAKVIEIDGAYHEIFAESDEYRDQLLHEVIGYFDGGARTGNEDAAKERVLNAG